MSRLVTLTDEQIEWLRESTGVLSYTSMARQLGCCVDTLKRILARHNIQQFDGAKYTPKFNPPQWHRPCMNCRRTDSRPKWQYICQTCKERADHENYGIEA